MTRRAWARGAITLALIGGLTAALIASPVGAAKKAVTKKKVKNISTNIFNSLFPASFNSAIGAAIATKQNTCQPGTVLAWAYVDADVAFPATYTTTGVSPQFNCAGGPVEVRRESEGEYWVRVPGLSNTAASNAHFVASTEVSDIVQGIGGDEKADYDTLTDTGQRVLGVVIGDTQASGDADNLNLTDDDFVVAVYGIGTGTAPARIAATPAD